jgi:manganese transport system permease protein
MLGISVAISVFSCVAGTYLSYHFDLSTGGAIVVVLTMLFVLTMIFAPKYGILAQNRHSQAVFNQAHGENSVGDRL